MQSDTETEVLIVGAGPTGLTLACELLAAGIPFRIIDAAPTPVHESRALAIQARTLEVLERSGVTPALVDEGDRALAIALHARGRTIPFALFDDAVTETAYPFILFLSQARTEAILLERLQDQGVRIERGTRLEDLSQDADRVTVVVDGPEGRSTTTARYVVGCDGAHSAVRARTGIMFAGRSFPQTFVIGDLTVDRLDARRVHAFVATTGLLFFFPLGEPAPWRMLGMLPRGGPAEALDLEALQATADAYVAEAGDAPLTLSDPKWITGFTIQSRRATRFREGRVFLAGDAAHIHSPAGGQGMNTGIQDAVNLGWKLAQVIGGAAPDSLLDTYETERMPVARDLLRMTDRLFRMATSSNRLVAALRPRVAPVALGIATRSALVRRIAFRTLSEIALHYRGSVLSGDDGPRGPVLRAGDRLPDLEVLADGERVDVRRAIPTPGYLLLAFGSPHTGELEPLVQTVIVVDEQDAAARARFGFGPGHAATVLIRPDGYIACRSVGPEQAELREFLGRWAA
jgi:2-polyprenyl-6-methoxyphenol hydroxylase-like FAD-dependent oxidoreductase